MFARINADGTSTSTTTLLSEELGSSGRIASNGAGYLATWNAGGAGGRYAFLDEDGQQLGPRFELGNGPMPIIWTGDSYAFTWSRINPAAPVHIVTMGAGGQGRTESQVSTSGEDVISSNLDWDGLGYGIVWSQARTPRVRGVLCARLPITPKHAIRSETYRE